jgi:glutathione S-transferase
MRYVNRSHTGRCTTNRLPLGGGQRIIPLHEAMCEKCPDWRGTPRRSSICIDRRYVLRSHAMLQLYGNPRSRAMRCLWMLEEVGEPYQLIEKSTRTDELQSVEYIRLNPNARIPTLVDGDLVLWESMAINLYLAQKYAGPMHCVDPKVLGLATQWSFWVMLEMEALLLDLLLHRAVLPEFARDASYAERDELLLRRPLGVLNSVLNGRDYLTDSNFTVADLNVASILAWGKMGRLDLSSHSNVARWLDNCLARSAYGRVRDRTRRK